MNPIRPKYILTLLVVCLAFSGLVFANGGGRADLPDSILTEDHIYKYLYTDRSKSERIMAEMRRRSTLPAWELDYIEGDLNYNTGRNREALKHYNAALESRHAKGNDTLRMELLHRQISCYDGLHDEVNKMRCIKRLMALAKKLGDKPMESIALFNMGKSLHYQGDKKRGYRYMEQGAEMMAATDYRLKYDNLRYEYKTLVMFYERDGLYDEVLRILDAWEKIVSASTGGEPAIDGLDESERKDLCAMRTVALSRLGRKAEAAECYRRFCALDKSLSRNNYLIMPYLFDTKQYGEIFRINLPRERFLVSRKDTVNYYMASVLKFLGYAYRDVGDYDKSSVYFERLAVLRDSLKCREQESAAQDYAALYDSKEKDRQILQEQQESRTAWTIAGGISVLLIVSGIFIVAIVRKNRDISNRNKALAVQVEDHVADRKELDRKTEENLALYDKLKQARLELETERGKNTPPKEPKREKSMSNENGDKMATEADRILFERIAFEIKNRQLFRNPDFSRTELLKIIHVPQNKFAGLFKQFAGKSFTEYVRDLRLSYANELFIEHPDWSMDAVIKECGMLRSSFYVAFIQIYGMNPDEFRKSIQKGHENSKSANC